MPTPAQEPGAVHADRTADAERIAYHRALTDNARRITDPQLRAEVEALATGASTPAEFVQFIDTSPRAWRGLHRTVTAYLALTDHQRAELIDQHHEQIATIQAEQDRPASPPTARDQIEPQETDESWEAQQTWLE
jgi:hypothetical protein